MKWFRNIENDKFCIKLIINLFVAFILFMLLGNLSWSESAANAIAPGSPNAVLLPMKCLELIVQTLLFYLVLSLYITKVLKKDTDYFRISAKNIRPKWLLAGAAVPGLLVAVYLIFFKGRFERGSLDVLTGICLTLLHGGFKAGITEEILFRGFFMKLFENRWNRAAAIILNSFLFAFIHLGNAPGITNTEALMMMLSYTACGVTFSIITYRENSAANTVFMHALWNIIAESNILRILAAIDQYDPNAIVNYRLESANVLLNGGFFGISASVLGGIAFLLPLGLLFYRRYGTTETRLK